MVWDEVVEKKTAKWVGGVNEQQIERTSRGGCSL